MKRILLSLLSLSSIVQLAHGQYHVGTSGTKNPVLEVSTGAWAGFCPDAFQDIDEKVIPMYGNTIVMAWHNGDPMQITGDPYCTGSGYIAGYPMGTIDRATFSGAVGQNRPFETNVGVRNALSPNFDVDMLCTYNPSTRVMDVQITGTALSSLTGNWYINGYVVEDSIASGPTSTYNQRNYYGSTGGTTSCTGSTSWWVTAGNPIMPTTLFWHNSVVRSVLAPAGSIWGEAAFTNPTAGTTVTKHYTYTVPTGSNPFQMSVVGMVEKFGATTSDREIENAVTSRTALMPIGGVTHAADSFSVFPSNHCADVEFYVTTPTYYTGLTVVTDYGDASGDTHPILSAGTGGYSDFTHVYATSGAYTVKHVLYSGSTAIDSVSYTHNYMMCNVIPVGFYLDANFNCVQDGGEPDIYQPSLTRVDSNGVTIDTISATSGFYYIAYGNAGDVYKFTVISTTGGFTVGCPSVGYITDTLVTGVSIDSARYFGMNCTTGSTFDLRIFPTVRAGIHTFRGNIAVDNTYCALTTGTISMTVSPKYDYWLSSVTPSSISGTTVTWNAGGLSTANAAPTVISFHFEAPGPWYAVGDTVYNDCSVSPTSGDINPSNNACVRVDTVQGGYDPNFMQVTPEGYISAGTKLQYTIEFENTGTDTAFNIRVMDTLSNNVDISSMRMLMSTAKMMVSNLTDAAGHHIVKFDFPKINLLDSSHHGKSVGMIVFTVNAKAGLPVGTVIQNRSGIYFDNNPVVLTNTVTDIIGAPSKVVDVNASNLHIYPNPAKEELVVNMTEGAYNSCTITNAIGSEMMKQVITKAETKLDIKNLAPGVYYISLKGDNGSKVQKFVKN